MPRARKSPEPAGYGPAQRNGQDGATQPPRAPTGMPYGEHQATIDTQAQMPLPDVQADMARAIQAAAALAPPEPIMGMPTMRPGEPPTAGSLPMAMIQPARPNTVASIYREIAQVWGDDSMSRLADEAERRGL